MEGGWFPSAACSRHMAATRLGQTNQARARVHPVKEKRGQRQTQNNTHTHPPQRQHKPKILFPRLPGGRSCTSAVAARNVPSGLPRPPPGGAPSQDGKHRGLAVISGIEGVTSFKSAALLLLPPAASFYNVTSFARGARDGQQATSRTRVRKL